MKTTIALLASLALACVPAFAEDTASTPVAGDAAVAEVPVDAAATSSETAELAAAPEAAPVAEADSGQEIGKPAPGKGQVVFFRPSKMTGALVGFKVREEGKELGVLKNGNYFVLSVEPGKHQYVVHSEAKDVLTMEVAAGEVYYVQGSITMGIMAGRPNLSPSTGEAFAAAKEKLKQSTL